jgi:hypothetical protein
MRFPEDGVISVLPETIGRFLDECTEGLSKATRHLRYAQLKAFFNYVIKASGLNIMNHCNATALFKTFKHVPHRPRKILDEETVDEIIFNSRSVNGKDCQGKGAKDRRTCRPLLLRTLLVPCC